jgi:hypothetical protein
MVATDLKRMDEVRKKSRWEWLKTLTPDELRAIELTDEERLVFNCPMKNS